ncbi:Zn(II)2Cys6 transcription factor [Aspergillus heteromorphus CBS 117.55]|uniref:Zn(II)2Cys6 transcription factor n=1 Tax=Aspergillus heteromorphus CBS 117.55 TaxID=1448321 RepID=A0A317WKD2_9EURO|nr:Zn(II)2Cys6 transcription factor [Aspergillus heteromorphus CBS 117.55]PWY86924.1 Zn(II)2Cys6 transcription factor [Aspergillus heteromorphus CBS 117.55]
MPARRTYRAPARNGCFECRNRRIKCPQEHPQCSHCTSDNIICQYLSSSTSLVWPRVKSRSTTPTIPPSRTASPSHVNPRIFTEYRVVMDTVMPKTPVGELNIQDLELMMQWCTTTYRSVSRNSLVEGIWQGVVPREAMRHPFLMHGILALSALHLAFSSPPGPTKDDYIRTAQTHQSQAVAGLSKVTGSLDRSNCNAAFALSSIMVVFSFALPITAARTATPPAGVLDELFEIFRFTRGSVDVQGEIIESVADGEFSPLLEYDNSQPKMPDTSRLAIMSLSRMNATLAGRDAAHEKDTYDTTIRYLGYSLDKLARGGETMIIAFQWIFQIPPRYLDLLRARQQFALVILAHYAVIIHSLRGHWWMGEWGARLIREIGQHLGADWRDSISWVVDATGCYVPPI